MKIPDLEKSIKKSKNNQVDILTEFFSENLKNKLTESLSALILFGSHARGDFTKNSDYDFLIILKEKNKELEDIILDVCVETLNKFDKLVTCLIWEEKDWELKKRFPIGKNILK
ncbi:MAG: nucleotidyltransferase domain-containing protein, partial [Leptospiraceae bacterium]|nr:nucleotidyltransferase domain-containing protein [Leptospiraceae bacterium]